MVKFTEAVWRARTKLRPAQKLVLLRIADRAQDSPHDGLLPFEANPGMRSLAAECELSMGAAARSVQKLQQLGAIAVVRRGAGKRSSVYRLNMAYVALHSSGTPAAEPESVALHSSGTPAAEPESVALHSSGTPAAEPESVALHSEGVALHSKGLAFHSEGLAFHLGGAKPEPSQPLNHRRESAPAAAHDLMEAWNELTAPPIPKCRDLSDKRRRAANSRLAEPLFKDFRNVIARIQASSFCRGDNDRRWTADFEWLLQPDTALKVMEGKYDDRDSRRAASAMRPAANSELNHFLDVAGIIQRDRALWFTDAQITEASGVITLTLPSDNYRDAVQRKFYDPLQARARAQSCRLVITSADAAPGWSLQEVSA